MYAELFHRSPLLALPLVALVLFLAVFAALLMRVLARRPQEFDPMAALPLSDGDATRPEVDRG
jgi:hypothetical protein